MLLNEMTNQTIITKLQATNKFVWLTTTNALYLDYEFYLNYSGEKETAPIIDILLNKGKTEDEVLDIICNILVTKYSAKWNRIYQTLLDTKYDPFDDYKKERETNSNVNQNTQTSTDSSSSTYGFNSTEAVPKDKASSESNVVQNKAQNTGNATESISGKIGGTSYQDLARKEVEIRLEHNLLDIVFKDISNEMCLSIY